MTWDEWIGSLDGRPTLWVKHLCCWFGCHVDLHKMVKADDEQCFHTHPAYAVRIILKGGYAEEVEGKARWNDWVPGMAGIVKPGLCHRIAGLHQDASFSLWIRFRKVAKIELRGEGWNQQHAEAVETKR